MKKFGIVLFALCLTLTACNGNNSTPSVVQSTTESSVVESNQPPTSSEPVEPSEPECEHVWVEASYQEPKTCSVCGETEGTPLVPVFEDKGYVNMIAGTAYPYKTTYVNNESSTEGRATVIDYKVIESDETREAREGFAWRVATVLFEYEGQAVRENGTRTRGVTAEYYTGKLFLDDVCMVNYNDVDYECVEAISVLQDEWVENVLNIQIEYAFMGPIDYDGYTLTFFNAANGSAEDNYNPAATDTLADIADSDTLFFRMA